MDCRSMNVSLICRKLLPALYSADWLGFTDNIKYKNMIFKLSALRLYFHMMCVLKMFHQSEMSLEEKLGEKKAQVRGESKQLTALCPAWGTL